MRKIFLGTTALAVASLASGAALAAGPELKISGAMDYAYVVQDGDSSTANTDGTDGASLFAGNSSNQMFFDFEATADNGLNYGGKVDWRFGNNTIDEHYLFFGGSWGTLHVGGDDGVIDNTVPGGESVLGGDFLWDGNNGVYATGAFAEFGPTLTTGTDDTNKFSYYSPSFAGLTVNASYIPSTDGGAAYTTSTTGGDNAGFEGSVRYDGTFGDVGVAAGVGYAMAEASDSNLEDSEGLMAGATVSFAGFSLGAGYGDNYDTGLAKNSQADAGGWWNVAASYSFGKASVGVGYAEGETSTGAATEDDGEYIGITADYAVAEGLKAYAEYGASEATVGATNVTSETDYFLLGTTVSF